MIDEHQERYYKKTPNRDNRTKKSSSSSSFASNLSEKSFEEEVSQLKLNRSKNK